MVCRLIVSQVLCCIYFLYSYYFDLGNVWIPRFYRFLQVEEPPTEEGFWASLGCFHILSLGHKQLI